MSEGARGAMMSRGRGPPAGSDAASERAIKLFSLLPEKKTKKNMLLVKGLGFYLFIY